MDNFLSTLTQKGHALSVSFLDICGPERIRTADFLIANEAFYQLNYRPCLVGDEGVEPSTSSLSEKRSTAELVAHIIYLAFFKIVKY